MTKPSVARPLARDAEAAHLLRARLTRLAVFVFAFCLATAALSPAQTFITLLSFAGTNGSYPVVSPIQGLDGNFYGTTDLGGANDGGVVFKITPRGVLTTLYSFCAQVNCADGKYPYPQLVQSSTGTLYGTTQMGGDSGYGTVFKISPTGALTTIHNFDSSDGTYPDSGLLLAADGNFYGATFEGGAHGYGTIFKITAGGALTTLHSFDGIDGNFPDTALVQATDGDFYGTTVEGGANNDGTIFKITPGGTLITLHSFNGTDGALPYGSLAQAADGNFYGTAADGGANGYGSVFRMTSAGDLTVLRSFDNTDGAGPSGGLIQATDGNFYGTTYDGGANNAGTVFRVTAAGTLTTLHTFDFNDGSSSESTLIQATNGRLYGTADHGGAQGYGTIFSLAVGLKPFVQTRPNFGTVGAAVVVLGNNLIGTTGVSFNGTAAAFTVVSGSEIKTTVPVGATTGAVLVTTPTGTLSSNASFRVSP